jgi:hypothetical protein
MKCGMSGALFVLDFDIIGNSWYRTKVPALIFIRDREPLTKILQKSI